MKTLTIVTINLNNVRGLRRTAESVLAQSNQNFEWIIIDGGSSDGSAEFIKQELSSRLSYWVSEHDEGIYFALNKGIEHAHGEYVICMNAGDVFHDKDVISSFFDFSSPADVIYGDWNLLLPSGCQFVHKTDKASLEFFYLDNLCHQAMFVRTSLLKSSPFDTTYKVYADWIKRREFAGASRSFAYMPKIICDFDAINTSVSRSENSAVIAEKNRRDNLVPGSWAVPRLRDSQYRIESLNFLLAKTERALRGTEEELNSIRSSAAYRIGRLMTFPMRALLRVAHNLTKVKM